MKAQDVKMSTSSYLSQIPMLASQNFETPEPDSKVKPPRRKYGKDLDCPQEWRTALAELLPEQVSHLGANDLMSKLPPVARAENMMVYIGYEGT